MKQKLLKIMILFAVLILCSFSVLAYNCSKTSYYDTGKYMPGSTAVLTKTINAKASDGVTTYNITTCKVYYDAISSSALFYTANNTKNGSSSLYIHTPGFKLNAGDSKIYLNCTNINNSKYDQNFYSCTYYTVSTAGEIVRLVITFITACVAFAFFIMFLRFYQERNSKSETIDLSAMVYWVIGCIVAIAIVTAAFAYLFS